MRGGWWVERQSSLEMARAGPPPLRPMPDSTSISPSPDFANVQAYPGDTADLLLDYRNEANIAIKSDQ